MDETDPTPATLPDYPIRDRPYAKEAYDRGRANAAIGMLFKNPYDRYAAPTFWRGYLIGYQSIYRFGIQTSQQL